MTWLILYNIGLTWVFAVVTHLDFIPNSFLIRWFLNVWMGYSFPQSYVVIIIICLGYLHNHILSTRFSIIAACLLFHCIISNQQVSGSIIAKYFSMSGPSWPSILIIHGIIISTNGLSQVRASTSLAVKMPYFKLGFSFLWKILQTVIWISMLSLKLVHH